MLPIVLIVALIATLLAVSGIAVSSTVVAGLLFCICLGLFFVTLAMGVLRRDGA